MQVSNATYVELPSMNSFYHIYSDNKVIVKHALQLLSFYME